jgi:diguanylate cyclase (GGDEF)-like protein/putative nucleotidyltransferase with HDIG domain
MILAFLAIITGRLHIKIPTVNSNISIGDTFIFTNLVLFGPAAGVITAMLDGLSGSLRPQMSARRVLYACFNCALMSTAAFIGGRIFFGILGRGPLYLAAPIGFQQLIYPLGVLALTHYLLNSGGVAAVVALEQGKDIYRIWRESFLWTSITYFAGAAFAGGIAANVRSVTPGVLGTIVPVLMAIYYTHKTYTDKLLELNKLYLSTVESLAMAIDAKDQLTHGHVRRVQVFARGLARALGVTDENALSWMEAAALLHDIGKLAIPEYILNKPGKLTRSEFKKVMIHPAVGSDILASIKFPYDVAKDVRYHHENWDGTGYPDHLRGAEIPLGARILAVVDCYDALICDRPYRQGMSRNQALELIRARVGTFYDPDVVRKFELILDGLEQQVHDLEIHDLNTESSKTIAEQGRTFEESAAAQGGRGGVYQDIISTHREVSALYELAQTLGSTLNLEEVLPVIASKISKLVPSTTCVIYLCSNEDNTLTAKHVSGANAEAFCDYRMPFGENLSGWVAAHNYPAANSDPALDIMPIRDKLTVDLKSALVNPLIYQDKCLGTISLYGAAGSRFHDDHIRIMEVVSGQAATAIHNAMKYEESHENAMTDRLTGLPNARYIDLFSEHELKKAESSQYPFSVLVMDLDGFKPINDRYGHSVGDMTLVEVAKVLRETVRKSDAVIRYAGDEFVAILPSTARAEASELAARIQDSVSMLRLPVAPSRFTQVGISVGIASYPVDGRGIQDLLERADIAMYQNKRLRSASFLHWREEPPRHLKLA